MKRLLLFCFLILGLNLSSQIINIPADYSTIQEGITTSVDGDTVLVQPGIYFENIDFEGKAITVGSLVLTTSDTSYISQTIINGGGNAATVSFLNSETLESVLFGFTITNGWCGIFIEGGNGPTLKYLIVRENLNYYNHSGIYKVCYGTTDIIIDHCIFENNMMCETVVFICNINTAEEDHFPSITNSIFRYNDVTSAVIVMDGETGIIDNVLIHDNIGKGIGIVNAGFFRTITNSTIVNNTDIGIYILYNNIHASTVNIQNCIVWGNSNYQVGVLTLTPMTIFNIDNSCIMNGIDGVLIQPTTQLNWGNNISSNPLFIDESNFNFQLSDCSPAIGFGDPTFALPYDLNGDIRPQPVGSMPDIGAFENGLGVPLSPPSISQQPAGTILCEGESHTMTVEAEGSPELIYQWQKNGVDIQGEVSNVFILNNLVLNDEANYRCLVSNSCETIFSNNAFVEVLEAVTFISQPENQAVYFGNDVLFEIATQGEEPITYQWYGPSGLIENEVSNQLLIENVTPADTGLYYCSVENSCGDDISNTAQLSVFEQLVAYYPFNGNANDESGNGNDGTVNGATLTTDRFGNANRAYDFDGVDDYIQLPTNTYFDGDFTVSGWVNLRTYNHCVFYDFSNGNDSDNVRTIFSLPEGASYHTQLFESTSGSNLFCDDQIPLNVWTHSLITLNGNQLSFYIDGDYVNTVTTNYIPLNVQRTINYIANSSYSGGDYTDAILDDISIYNRSISQQEIDSLYHDGGWDAGSSLVAHYPFNGSANDESGNSNDGTVNGATLTDDRFGNENSAYYFNGNSDYINIQNSSTLNFGSDTSFTINVWINTDNFSPLQGLIEKAGDDGSGVGGWQFMLSNDKVYSEFGNGTTGGAFLGNETVNLNTWYMATYIVNRELTIAYHYINGVMDQFHESSAFQDNISNTVSLRIGAERTFNPNYYFEGEIDDISIYNRSLSQQEIDSLYHIGGWGELNCDFSASPLTGTQPLNVSFTDYSTGTPSIWKWDFDNDGNFDSYIQYPTHTYASPGTYSVKLVIENADGSDSLVKNNYIIVTPQTIGTDLIAYYPFNGNADDESGNSHHGTILGATLTNDRFGNNNSAYIFDGANDYIFSTIGDSDTLAVSFWYKAPMPDKHYPTFFSYYNTGFLGQYGGTLSPPYTSGDVICMPVNSGLQTTPIPEYDQWHHVYMDIDNIGHTQIVYVDGLYDNTYSGTSTISTGNDFHIGVGDPSGTPSQYFTGSLDDLRIYGRRLNEQEIVDLYNISNITVPEICIVTVDEESGYNYVVWEKQITTEIDSFKVYRESTYANVFEQIAVVPYSEEGIYLDEGSIPVQRPYKYKLSAISINGTESLLSNYHKTIHLTYSPGPQGMNLDWAPYEGFEFPTYYIYKSSNPNTFDLIDSISGSFTSYTDIYPPWGNVYYAIEVINDNGCFPSRDMYNRSRSNTVQTPLGIDEDKKNDIRVFPIPTNNNLIIEVGDSWDTEHMVVKIINLQGKVEVNERWHSTSKMLNISSLSLGMYIIWISDGESQFINKIIKN